MLADAEAVRAAYGAAVSVNVEPLVSMLDPALEWRGVSRGHLWWKRTPSSTRRRGGPGGPREPS